MEGHTVRAVLNTGATDILEYGQSPDHGLCERQICSHADMNHQFIILSEHAKAGETYELAFYVYSSAYAGTFTGTNFFRLSWQSTGKRRLDSIMTCRLSMKLRIFCRRTIYPGSRALKHWKDA